MKNFLLTFLLVAITPAFISLPYLPYLPYSAPQGPAYSKYDGAAATKKGYTKMKKLDSLKEKKKSTKKKK